jgi:hypothetical protein
VVARTQQKTRHLRRPPARSSAVSVNAHYCCCRVVMWWLCMLDMWIYSPFCTLQPRTLHTALNSTCMYCQLSAVGSYAGFSEFAEFVARVAVEGLQQDNYEVVFPTPFSKV